MTDPADSILTVPLARALGDRYLAYALSTITARSLPDVRDGLKPVHRRVLFAMRDLRLSPDATPKKSARVIGDVIGKYHPHGDQSVYDALVRLAQDFAVRYPLIDGQGNFGNIDGDNAAAMRYTEARLTAVAEALLEGLDEDAVDFRDTYDGEGQEPAVLPAAFPNLLANGAQGIAVGMATNIPPHNAGELCAALRALIADRDVPDAKLLDHVTGPDFPTGGILVETKAAIAEAYRTGRGGFRVRARWSTEKLGQGQYQIVVTEIPYQVTKSKLIERVADLLTAKKLPFLADIRDESAEDIRLILEPKSRNVDADVLMEQLFRLTDLESRISLNLNVLDASGVPRVMSLKEALLAFLDHRRSVLQRRTRHRLDKIAHRLEVLAGMLIAFLNLDEVIRIIREEDDPKASLMATFDLTDVQAEAILNMRLRSLRRLEEMELRREHEALSAEQAELTTLLGDPGLQWIAIGEQIDTIDRQFGRTTELGRRRTDLGGAPSAVVVPLQAAIEREPLTIFLSEKGWIRAVRGHQTDVSDVKYKEGDRPGFVVHAETVDRLILFDSTGRAYTLSADKVPRGRGFGEPVRLSIDVPNDAAILTLRVHRPDGAVLVAATDGRGFRVNESDLLAQTRSGRQVLNVTAPVEAAVCVPIEGDMVAVVGTNRRLLCFPLDEVNEMARGRGVLLQKYRDARLSDVTTFNRTEGLTWRLGERTRTVPDIPIGKRGGVGQLPPRGFPTTNRFR